MSFVLGPRTAKMMAFPGMLISACKEAGIPYPLHPEGNWNPEDYPRFHLFCSVQLCRPIRMGEHWDNAKVIAAIPEDQLMTITLAQLIEMGLEWHNYPV